MLHIPLIHIETQTGANRKQSNPSAVCTQTRHSMDFCHVQLSIGGEKKKIPVAGRRMFTMDGENDALLSPQGHWLIFWE